VKVENKLNTTMPEKMQNNSVEFGIEMTSFAFEQLSGNKLYTDLHGAIVRELSCNCYDGHVLAGNTAEPFYLHLPTYSEPYLGFRDYGVGMSKEQMEEVYTSVFKSTKRDSDEQIGGFGLGSKTPLGYTSNFSVSSYQNGIRRDYTVFKNDKGIPSLLFLVDVPTTEKNGLEIKLPVKISDCDSFKRAALKYLKHFTVKPNCNVELVFPEKKYEMENIIPGVHLKSYITYGSKPVAVEGFVEYSINPDLLPSKYRTLLCRDLELHFDAGTLKPNMNRESLSYTENTINAITRQLDKVIAALPGKIDIELGKYSSDFEKFNYINTIKNDSILSDAKATWIKENLSFVENIECYHSTIDYIIETEDAEEIEMYVAQRRRSVNTLGRIKAEVYRLPITFTSYIVFDDLGKHTKSRLKDNANMFDSYSKIVLIKGKNGAVTQSEKEYWIKYFGNIPDSNIKYISSMERKKRDTAYVSRYRTDMLVFNNANGKFENSYTQLPEMEEDQICYYVPLKNTTPTVKIDMTLISSLFARAIKENDVGDSTVYNPTKIIGIRGNSLKEVSANEQFINVEGVVNTYLNTIDLAKLENTRNTQVLYSAGKQSQLKILSKLGILDKKYINMLSDYEEYNFLSGVVYYIANVKNIRYVDPPLIKDEFDNMVSGVINKYPMLKHTINNYLTDDLVQDLTQYIELVNRE